MVCDQLCRLARDAAEALDFFDEMKASGVRLITSDGFDSDAPTAQLLFGIKAVFAQFFLEETRHRVKRGMNGGFKRGAMVTAIPYGYKIDFEKSGVEGHCCWMVDPFQAEVVLDFDGVAHRFGEEAIDDYGKLIDNQALFCWLSFLEAALEPYPQAKIIVSSDWRRLFSDEQLVELLGPALGLRFAGVVSVFQSSRAQEILREAQLRGLEGWIALDDHPTVVAARAAGDLRFIVCQPDLGLSDPSVQAELRLRLAELTADTGAIRVRGEPE